VPTMMVNRSALAAIISARNLTLVETAAMSHLSYSIVRHLVNGVRVTCSDSTVIALARALGVEPTVIATEIVSSRSDSSARRRKVQP
jgi:hypothetical protein